MLKTSREFLIFTCTLVYTSEITEVKSSQPGNFSKAAAYTRNIEVQVREIERGSLVKNLDKGHTYQISQRVHVLKNEVTEKNGN